MMGMGKEGKRADLSNYLKESNYTVVFTGAGMSTEAGLPDFRSASTGMWNGINPLELASTQAMKQNRQAFIDFYRHRVDGLRKCKPHAGHDILADWESKGMIRSIITQNVDGFHHKAGNNKVAELHGTLRTCHCNDCGKRYPIDRFMSEDLSCKCGGFIRPSVVLFGESLPDGALDLAELEAQKADLFIVMGSSLTVSPANLFPMIAKRQGAKLVIINMDKTELDHEADLVVNGLKIGSLLEELSR
jgi:NAD-dependent deacetylase